LDVTDACLCAAEIVKSEELKAKLLRLAEHWRNAYGADALMSEDSPYYEGDRYTYSFRIQQNMDARVELAGGKARFAQLLDDFFGFGGESVKKLIHVGAAKEIEQAQHHRFQGFNNECDMEAPYAYIFADRHDRLCDILHECVQRSFGLGKSGLPGNNDSGGLSSLFVWNVLGIFPISGSGELLIGAPQIEGAELKLANGGSLCIRVNRLGKQQIYVDRVRFNGHEVADHRLSWRELMQGGVLEFDMK
jgi:putative alpha-1,2-mannosidase